MSLPPSWIGSTARAAGVRNVHHVRGASDLKTMNSPAAKRRADITFRIRKRHNE